MVIYRCNLPRLEIDTGSPRGGIGDLGTPLPTLRELEKNTRARDNGPHLLHRKVVAVNRTSLRATHSASRRYGA